MEVVAEGEGAGAQARRREPSTFSYSFILFPLSAIFVIAFP
jgi:hypothetical protein